jgi:hypothetical protein
MVSDIQVPKYDQTVKGKLFILAKQSSRSPRPLQGNFRGFYPATMRLKVSNLLF